MQTAKKLSDAKLAKDFQSVLREFEKAQHLAAERESAYAPHDPAAAAAAGPRGGGDSQQEVPEGKTVISTAMRFRCGSFPYSAL